MGSSEVQVFDGDGAVPPEITKLIQENEELRRQIRLFKEESESNQKDLQHLFKHNDFLQRKITKIMKVLKEPLPGERYDDDGNLIDTYAYEDQAEQMKTMMPEPEQIPDDWKKGHRKNYDL